MKAIFFGNFSDDFLKRVYPSAVIQRIKKNVEIRPEIFRYDDLEAKKSQIMDADFLFSTWGMPACSQKEIRAYFPSLKALFFGAGSVQSFARPFLNCGVRVFSAWAANAIPVAEFTVAQIVLANKGFFRASNIYKNQNHPDAARYCNGFPGNYNTKIGIIGAGMIGSLVAELLKPYRLEVLAFDPFMDDVKAVRLGVKKCSLEEMFAECQTITNHLANNEQTKNMLNYPLFASMKSNATFINTGRGAQVVEADLVRALAEKPDRTAILDVTYPEPPIPGHPFYTMENVILTPHIAGSQSNEIARMGEYMADECVALIANQPLHYEVTLKMLETMA